METNKKCCENCIRHSICEIAPKDNYTCWERHPRKWLGLLPEVGGSWFWRKDENDAWEILPVTTGCHLPMSAYIHDKWIPISELGGQWQGPIVPMN